MAPDRRILPSRSPARMKIGADFTKSVGRPKEPSSRGEAIVHHLEAVGTVYPRGNGSRKSIAYSLLQAISYGETISYGEHDPNDHDAKTFPIFKACEFECYPVNL